MENNTNQKPAKCKYASVNDSFCEKYGLFQWNLGEAWRNHCLNGGKCDRLTAEEQKKQSDSVEKAE